MFEPAAQGFERPLRHAGRFRRALAGAAYQEDRQPGSPGGFDFPFNIVADHYGRVIRPAQLRQHFRIIRHRLFGEMHGLVGGYQRERVFFRRQPGPAHPVLNGLQWKKRVGGDHDPITLFERPFHQADSLRDRRGQGTQVGEYFIVKMIDLPLQGSVIQVEF